MMGSTGGYQLSLAISVFFLFFSLQARAEVVDPGYAIYRFTFNGVTTPPYILGDDWPEFRQNLIDAIQAQFDSQLGGDCNRPGNHPVGNLTFGNIDGIEGWFKNYSYWIQTSNDQCYFAQGVRRVTRWHVAVIERPCPLCASGNIPPVRNLP